MKFRHRIILIVLVVGICAGCDQVTKTIARNNLMGVQPRALFGNIFHLHYTENSGAALSIGATLPEHSRFFFFVVFTGFTLTIILLFTMINKKLTPLEIVALSLVFGGGLSNLLDRIFKGGVVVDFMIIGIGDFRTGIFNIADVAIVTGALLFILSNARLFSNNNLQASAPRQ